MNLSDYRKQIDKIDKDILRLFYERMDVIKLVAEFKKENGLPVLDASRENDKLDAIDDLPAQKLFKTLFELSREYQKDIV